MAADADTETGPIALAPGTVVAERYSIVEVIGQGGMGVVYKAQHIHMEKFVALKMMLEQHSSASQDYRRFQREAQAASLLDHPHIVAIHDFGYANGQAYLCMDYLEGKSLDSIINRAPLTLDQFRHIFSQVCDALQHAHDRGMVHRDLKPSNLMLIDRHNDPQFSMVLDFGLVKMMDAETGDLKGDHKLTMTNMVLGSPLYMSPEQCRAAVIDHRSDIYSLGCVMYEALTGVPPLIAETLFDIMSKHISDTPRPLRETAPGLYVPSALEHLIFRAMAKSPENRPQSMKAFAAEIEKAFSGAPELTVPRTNLLGAASGGGTAYPGASSAIREKVKRQKRQKQTLVACSIALGAFLIGLVPAGIMYNVYLDKVKNNAAPKTGDPSASKDSSFDTASGANSSPGKLSDSPFSNKQALEPSTKLARLSILPDSKILPPLTGDAAKSLVSSMPIPALPNAAPKNGITPFSPVPVNGPNAASPAPPGLPSATNSPSNEAVFVSSGNRTSEAPRAPSAESLQSQADFAFRGGDYAQARQKYEELLKMGVSSSVKTPVLAKLAVSSSKTGDTQATKEYLDQFKDSYGFGSSSVDNDDLLLYGIAQLNRSAYDSPDPSYMERLLKSAIEAHSRRSGVDRDLIVMKLELNRTLMDQGHTDEAIGLLTQAAREAEPFPDVATQVNLRLQQLTQRPGEPQGGITPMGQPPLPFGSGPGEFGPGGSGPGAGGGPGGFGGPGGGGRGGRR